MKALAIIVSSLLLTNIVNAGYWQEYERDSNGEITKITDSFGGEATFSEDGFEYKTAEDLRKERRYERRARERSAQIEAEAAHKAYQEKLDKERAEIEAKEKAAKELEEKRKDPNFVAQEKFEKLKASAIHKVTGNYETWTAYHPNGKKAYFRSSDGIEQEFDESGKMIYYKRGNTVIQ